MAPDTEEPGSKVVVLYGGSGRYTGAAFEWASPELGGLHKFILFLAQSGREPCQDAAEREVEQFGFSDIELRPGLPIDVESLNDPRMAAFRRHYEGAFAEGSSLVWYP